MRLKRTQIQMTYAQMMAPPEEEDSMPEPEKSSKNRKLKKEA